jgi:formylglycine-generating enzyme required for sulfatase activity
MGCVELDLQMDTPPTLAPALDRVPTGGGQRGRPFPDMIWVPGGTFRMGSDKHYPEERPQHRVTVDGFWMDRYPVSNERFARFVEATGHRTFAEIPPNPADYPDALPHMLYAGSLVFVQPSGTVDLKDFTNWWKYVRGANWRHPYGAEDTNEGLETHPVVHVTFSDAEACAQWEGKALPTEAEWEFAARGGMDGAAYAWGGDFLPNDRHMANTWQGEFPWQRDPRTDTTGVARWGVPRRTATGVDAISTVWEWTAVSTAGIPVKPLGVLHPHESPRASRGRQLRSVSTCDQRSRC